MLRKIIIASALLFSTSAFAQQSQKDMIISADALNQLGQELNEVPFKYASPMLTTLQRGLKPLPETKAPDIQKAPESAAAPKPDEKKK